MVEVVEVEEVVVAAVVVVMLARHSLQWVSDRINQSSLAAEEL